MDMRPHLPTTLLAATLALLTTASTALAQDEEMTFDSGEVPAIYQGVEAESDASPSIGNDEEALRQIYPDDPLFNTKLKIERHLGIYLIRYPQRDETERIEIDKRDINATIWVSIGSREENELACKMVRWVVFGRTRWSKGARGVFSEFDDLNAITIRFVNVRLRDNKKERVKKKLQDVMEATLTRKDFEKLKLEEVEDALGAEDCVAAARKFLTRYNFNARYFDAFKAEQ